MRTIFRGLSFLHHHQIVLHEGETLFSLLLSFIGHWNPSLLIPRPSALSRLIVSLAVSGGASWWGLLRPILEEMGLMLWGLPSPDSCNDHAMHFSSVGNDLMHRMVGERWDQRCIVLAATLFPKNR